MQKIGQFQAYAELTEAKGAVFLHPEGLEDQARKIKMRLLSESAVNLFIEPLTADPETGEVEPVRFLARVEPGMENIEFYYLGSFQLTPVGGNVWLDTYDNTSFDIESLTPESFARVWEREERDPRILEMEMAARYNQRLRDEQLAVDRAEHNARMAELDARIANVSTSKDNADGVPASVRSDAARKVSPVKTEGVRLGDSAAEGGIGGEPQTNA